MPFEKDPNEIGVLWIKTSQKGVEYLSGTIGGEAVVCFRTNKKSEKQPDWRVMKSQPRNGQSTPPITRTTDAYVNDAETDIDF